MSFQTISLNIDQNIATVTLNRPESLNSLNAMLLDELHQALKQVADSDSRALLITGAGRGFCAGADLSENVPLDSDGKPDLGKALDERYHPVLETLYAIPMPVIVAVNGVAAGAGASIALAGDIVIAAQSAYFKQAFVNIGLLPDASGTWLLPRLAGRARAMGMCMLGEKIPAEQAEAWGMIWKTVDDADLGKESQALAEHLAKQPTQALIAIKQALHASANNDLTTQLELEAAWQRRLGKTQDFQEGAMAFIQKRPAKFTGH